MAKVTLSKDSLTVPTIIFNNGVLSSDENGNLTWNGQQVGGSTLDASGDITFTGLDTFTQYVTFNGGMISNGDIILNGSKLLLANGASVELYTGDGLPLPEGGIINPGTGNSGESIDTSNFAKLNEDNTFTGNNNFTGNLTLDGKNILTEEDISSLPGKHNVGEQWISMDGTIPFGGIPFLGQTVSKETYSELYDWVESNGRFKTEEEWQSLYSANNSNVSFYAKVDDNTFRLPYFKGYLKANETAGGYTKEGLPDITGHMSMGGVANASYATGISNTAGAITGCNAMDISSTTTPSGIYANAGFNFSASKSNSIYGNSTHVTPETNTILVGVYAFNTIINPSNLDVESLRLNYVTKANGEITSKLTLTEGIEAIFRKNGARLYLCGLDDTDLPGTFILRCPKNEDCSEYVDLNGNKNGGLTWGGNPILCQVASAKSGTNWYIKYSNGLIMQGGTVNAYDKSLTFPTAFSDTNYAFSMILIAPSYINTDYAIAAGKTTTGISDIRMGSANGTGHNGGWSHSWIAIGY